jgi:holo-[acyl-carrier protein] synthase
VIVGIGVDVVDIERFSSLMERQPTFLTRILTHTEIHHRDGSQRSAASLAARFAAKEAVAKSLGGPAGLSWHDVVVITDESGKPTLEITGSVEAFANALHVTRWHISLTHDGGHSIAYVIAES